MAGPTLDGSGHGSTTGSFTATATLTTTQTNDVIIAFVNCELTNGAAASITSVAGGGLTWAKRQGISGFNTVAACHCVIEEWWAPAAAIVSAQVITVTGAGGAGADHVSIHVFGVHGALDINNPFDPNASAKIAFSYLNNTGQSSAVAANVAQVSTTKPDNLICSYFWTPASPTNTSGTGMTQIAVENNAGGTNWDNSVSQYIVVASPQTALGTVFTNTNESNYVVLADSITSDSNTSETDVPLSTHGLGVSMSVTFSLNLPPLNAGLGITMAASPLLSLPVAKIVPAPFLLGFTETYNSLSNLLLPPITFSLGLSVARWQTTQVRVLSASMSLGLGEAIARFGSDLPLPTVTMSLGINSNLPLITGGTTRQIHTVIDAGT